MVPLPSCPHLEKVQEIGEDRELGMSSMDVGSDGDQEGSSQTEGMRGAGGAEAGGTCDLS